MDRVANRKHAVSKLRQTAHCVAYPSVPAEGEGEVGGGEGAVPSGSAPVGGKPREAPPSPPPGEGLPRGKASRFEILEVDESATEVDPAACDDVSCVKHHKRTRGSI